MLNAVAFGPVDADEVARIRSERECGMGEAKQIVQTSALYCQLSDMRYRQGAYEDVSADVIVDEILEMLMAATNFNS